MRDKEYYLSQEDIDNLDSGEVVEIDDNEGYIVRLHKEDE